MQTFSEQMSSAGRAQVQAQFDLFGSLAAAAIDNAGKLALLQLHAVRETLDRSGAMWFEMMSAGSPRLMQAPAPAPASAASDEMQASRQSSQAPAQSVATAIGEPDAPRTPIARAAAQVAPAAAPMHPVAPQLPVEGKVELPRIRPLEAEPPPPSLMARPRRKPAPRK